MVRTRAENSSRKAVAAKAPRKSLGSESNGGSSMASCYDSSSKNGSFPLINHAKMWPTPTWQKGIKSFFSKNENYETDTSCGSSSGSSLTQDDITEPTTLVTENASNNELITEDKENLLPSSGSSLTNTSASSSSSSSSSTKRVSKIDSKKKRRVVMDDESD
ncbi:PCNA-associated factor isoform X1 [Hydra vulgaris]|uniref:PCNA-associated factor isoform X1 n=1 Tax=Hydra vulgaris TaxID=6087 RepID=UPI0001927365|nr:PCNA-associated factor [Hydra vulgaris]